jgi:DNA invertase Pin-like site-specific DNA recombinase
MHIMNMTNENSRPYITRNVYPNKRVPAQMNPEQIVQSIKNIAKGIHEGSYKMTKTVRILHQSGAINDLTHAVYDATVAARDTAREIRDTARDLKEDGIIGGTAKAIQETTVAARVTVHTVRDITTETTQTLPKAIMTKLPEWP